MRAEILILCCVALITQAASPRGPAESLNPEFDGLRNDRFLADIMNLISSGIKTAHKTGSIMNYQDNMDVNALSVPNHELDTCNYKYIEKYGGIFFNMSINLILNITDPVEDMIMNVNNCTSMNFPGCISCYLDLSEKCELDIQTIKKMLDTYLTNISPLFYKFIKVLKACFNIEY